MQITKNEIVGAVARGWCRETTKHKIMDPTLAFEIADEVYTLMKGAHVVMEPTVGRIVYYNGGTIDTPLLLSAQIAAVNLSGTVNLMVVDTFGRPTGTTNVKQGSSPCEWDWMPYQKEKAVRGDINSESAEPRPNEIHEAPPRDDPAKIDPPTDVPAEPGGIGSGPENVPTSKEPESTT